MLVEQDLRWGITSEDALSGKTVELCLEGIKKSKPFFIGIIGERYGWIPTLDDISDRSVFNQEGLPITEYAKKGKSITEIEFLYGALEADDKEIEAAFFIKDVPPSASESQESQLKLKTLRNKVLSQSRFPVSVFRTSQELGDAVTSYIKNVLKKRFPEKRLSFSQYIDNYQKSLINRVLSSYVKRREPLEELYEFIDNDDFQSATVHGVAGSGKTSLLCYFITELTTKRPSLNTIFCSVGATEQTSSKYGIARYIFDKVNNLIGGDESVDFEGKDDKQINTILQEKFKNIPEDERVILIIDGLDKLSIDDGSFELRWLPKLPKGMNVIFSSRDLSHPGLYYYSVRETEMLLSVDYHIQTETLTRDEIVKISTSYLRLYGKTLDADLLHIIADCPAAAHASSLCFLLDEMRYYGNHEKLESHVRTLASVKNENSLVTMVLNHISEELSLPDGIRDIFFFIEGSRYGLTEKEIIDLTQLTGLDWAVFSGLSQSILSSSGDKITIADWIHDYVVESYGIDEHSLTMYRKRILDYFSPMTIDGVRTERSSIEVPWQLLKIGDYLSLFKYASDICVFNQWYMADPQGLSECLLFWRPLLLNGYTPDAMISKETDADNIDAIYHLSIFCKDNGLWEQRKTLVIKLLKYYDCIEMDESERLGYIGNLTKELADIYAHFVNIKEAEAEYDRALAAFESLGLPSILDRAVLLTDYGWMYYRIGDNHKAIIKYEAADALYRKMLDMPLPASMVLPHFGIMTSNASLAYASTNEEGMAEKAYQAAMISEQVSQDLLKIDPIGFAGNMLKIEKSVIGVLLSLGEVEKAKTIFGYTEGVFAEKALQVPHRHAADYGEVLTNLATTIYKKQSKLEEAASLFDRAIHLFNQYFEQAGKSISSDMGFGAVAFYYRAELFKETEDSDNAYDCYQSAISLSRKLFRNSGTMQSILYYSISSYLRAFRTTDRRIDSLNYVLKSVLGLREKVNGDKAASTSLVKTYEFIAQEYQQLGDEMNEPQLFQNSARLNSDAAHIMLAVIDTDNTDEVLHYYLILGDLAYDAIRTDNKNLVDELYYTILEGRTVELLKKDDIDLLNLYIKAAWNFFGEKEYANKQGEYSELALLCYVRLHEKGVPCKPKDVLMTCFCYLNSRESDQLTAEFLDVLSSGIDFVKQLASESGEDSLSDEDRVFICDVENMLASFKR